MSSNQPWSKIQERLMKWQANPSAWELRKILSDSEHFREIAIFAARRAKNRKPGVTWQDWWGFYLEKMPEKEAIQLLLDVWNKDVKAFLAKSSRQQANQIIEGLSEYLREFPETRIDLRLFGAEGKGSAGADGLRSPEAESGPREDGDPKE